MTRTAATRNRRGTIPRLTEINSSLPPQPGNVPADIASPDATAGCASKNANDPSFKSARSCARPHRHRPPADRLIGRLDVDADLSVTAPPFAGLFLSRNVARSSGASNVMTALYCGDSNGHHGSRFGHE